MIHPDVYTDTPERVRETNRCEGAWVTVVYI